MKHYFWAAFVSWCVVIASMSQCKGWDDVPASATAPSKDYPCGVIGVVCLGPDGGIDHECCWEGDTCPGNPGCPASENMCCNIRSFTPDVMGARREDAGASVLPAWQRQIMPPYGHVVSLGLDGGIFIVRPTHPAIAVP